MNGLIAVIAFFVAIGPLIMFHELGHYWIARWCGVKVLRFSLGFGKPLLRIVRGKDKTEWLLSAIPFGGYVAMLDEREKESFAKANPTEADLKRAFNRQPVAKRIAIVAAGPIANLLLAIVVYWIIGMAGTQEPRALLGQPPAQSLAAVAGINAGDEVRALNGEPVLSLSDLRWRLMKTGIDQGRAELEMQDRQGRLKNARIDLVQFSGSDLEKDFMQKIGLVPMLSAPVINKTLPDSVAQRAGLMGGDRIVSVNQIAIDSGDDLRKAIGNAPNQTLHFELERAIDGKSTRMSLDLVPEAKPDPAAAPDSNRKVGRIGVEIGTPLPMTLVRHGPIDSMQRALYKTWDMSVLSLRLLGKMLAGEISLKNLSGPVTIADYAGQSAQLGLIVFLAFVASISVSIGIMNLLPIPVLDGGHLLYYLLEIFSGRPPSERLMAWGQKLGLLALAAMMAVALFNDFSRLLS